MPWFRAIAPACGVLCVDSMKIAAAVAAALLVLPSLAAARPITAGVGLGRIQSKADADSGGPAVDTSNVFGRIGLTPRVGAQVELQRISSDSTVMRSGTLLVVVELASSGRLMPLMFGGLGIDRISDPWGDQINGTHKEGGFALEYRADGGFVVGGDVRLGGISLEPQKYVLEGSGTVAYGPPVTSSTEYRSARLYAAIRF